MFFRKKKRMVDIRELQKRGVVRIPNKSSMVPTNPDGFVELGANSKPLARTNPLSNTDFFSSTNTSSSNTTNKDESERITELDNKIYKLEQRIELLEKKLDINQPSNTSVGIMGW